MDNIFCFKLRLVCIWLTVQNIALEMNSWSRNLELLIKSRTSLIWIRTKEEERLVPVDWNIPRDTTFNSRLKIVGVDYKGLLKDLLLSRLSKLYT